MAESENKQRVESEDYIPVTPNIYANRIEILCGATRGGSLVTLPVWLDEPFVYNNDGAVLKVRTVLKNIADREGAHIISLKGKDKKEQARIAFPGGPIKAEDAPSMDFVEHWEQFVIDAGMRLLDARRSTDERPLIAHGIDVPERQVMPARVLKNRSSMGKLKP